MTNLSKGVCGEFFMLYKLSPILSWLLEGDVSIQYQSQKDLLDVPSLNLAELKDRIATEGWGKCFLDKRNAETGLWGNGIYLPKWISTHYTLLDLKNLGIDPANRQYVESSEILIDILWGDQGGKRNKSYLDLCVSAMVLSICCYSHSKSHKIKEILDYVLEKQFYDGGWNCRWPKGDCHSSLHTTLSVLEAFRDYRNNGYDYRILDVQESIPKAWEFILNKKLFRTSHSGEIIDPKMLMLSYPCRWRYDILRCMYYFSSVQKGYDKRMKEALDLIIQKKRSNNRWPVQHKHAGIVHFEMEKTGSDSRWNTLRVLRILRFYDKSIYNKILYEEG